jgi:hypothetical protein
MLRVNGRLSSEALLEQVDPQTCGSQNMGEFGRDILGGLGDY